MSVSVVLCVVRAMNDKEHFGQMIQLQPILVAFVSKFSRSTEENVSTLIAFLRNDVSKVRRNIMGGTWKTYLILRHLRHFMFNGFVS